MKILFTYEYPFHKAGYGGGQQIIRDLSKSLANQGHDVCVSCLGYDELGLNTPDSNVKFRFLYDYKVGLNSFFYSTLSSLRLIHSFKPDIVLSFSSEAFFLSIYCKLIQIPFYIYVAAPNLPIFNIYAPLVYFKNIRYHLPLYFQYLGSKFSNKIYTISEFITQQALANWGSSRGKTITVGCGISDYFIHYKIVHHVDKLESINLASIGRIMYAQKPINELAICLSSLKSFFVEWHVVGTGRDFDHFKSLIKKLDLNKVTQIHSTLTTVEICRLYDNIDIVILPSSNESFFITVYEAISLGKIVITTRVALLDEIFKDFNTVIFINEITIEELKKAFEVAFELLKTPQIEIKLLEASEFVKVNYNWEKIGKNLIQNL